MQALLLPRMRCDESSRAADHDEGWPRLVAHLRSGDLFQVGVTARPPRGSAAVAGRLGGVLEGVSVVVAELGEDLLDGGRVEAVLDLELEDLGGGHLGDDDGGVVGL